MIGSAEFSRCNRYRYVLRRDWEDSLFRGAYRDQRVTWVMLNPSTADASVDDPTIRRCIGFSRAWGYGRLSVVNLFAFRTPYPSILFKAAEPIGDVPGRNDEVILSEARDAGLVVAAWGAVGQTVLRDRARAVDALLTHPPNELTLHCLGTTKYGDPRHPLMVVGDAMPQRWDGPR